MASPGSPFVCFFYQPLQLGFRSNASGAAAPPVVNFFVSAWLPTASWRERVAKVLSFLCRSNYYDPIWILIFSNNGFFGYLDY